jgi:hypothetical protein
VLAEKVKLIIYECMDDTATTHLSRKYATEEIDYEV